MNLAVLGEWVTYARPRRQADLRLFCFPHAGGGASLFRLWADNLPDTIEVCPIQLPGREGRWREAPFTRLEALISALGPRLLPYLDRPFAFFGHSMGALISFELARYLRREHGLLASHLLVSAHQAPHLPRTLPDIHRLPDAACIERLQRLSGTPVEVFQHPELMQLMLPVLRADFALCETYTYVADEPLDCPVSAFGGMEDPDVGRDRLASWEDETRSFFQLRIFPGNHFFLKHARVPLLQAVAADLHETLAQASLTVPLRAGEIG